MQLCTHSHPHTALLPGVIQGYQIIAVMFQVFLPSNSHHKKQKCLPKSYASVTKWLSLPKQQGGYTKKNTEDFFMALNEVNDTLFVVMTQSVPFLEYI